MQSEAHVTTKGQKGCATIPSTDPAWSFFTTQSCQVGGDGHTPNKGGEIEGAVGVRKSEGNERGEEEKEKWEEEGIGEERIERSTEEDEREEEGEETKEGDERKAGRLLKEDKLWSGVSSGRHNMI